MSDASTNQSTRADGADVQEIAAGRGRHRGPVSSQDRETAPRGRHRKPTQEAGTVA
ncbi:hypothetical protein ACFY4K_32710 [Streptomyces leeuwenhoekii]|jgi:hypothetical protein|uniref:Uncharacterized protein n=1 Tax=Streptomyces leeuwenhoekii TaxID=1437453 RepID=A0A0F7VUZ3_STRLW|nr:hypothetical protein [Streptomyces leeuwenhoekii]CQR64339.1 Hypothetical Protein sle_48810 [Streptomyces leeuwenhoekii]